MNATPHRIADNVPSEVEKARLLHDLGRYEEVLRLLMPLLDRLDGPETGYRFCVSALQQLKRHEESLHLVERGLLRHPHSVDLILCHASVLGFCGRYEKALEQAEAALALNPENPDAHHHRAFCLMKLKRYSEAKEAADAALALLPDDPGHLTLLAHIECLRDNTLRANELAEQVLRDNPGYVDALTVKAVTSRGIRAKLKLFRQALALDPTDTDRQELYNLFARQLPRDLAIWLLLILATGLAGFLRPHPAASWLFEAAYPLALASGLFMLRSTYYHLGGHLITTTMVFSLVSYWNGTFGPGTIPMGAVLGVVILVALVLFRAWLSDSAEDLQNKKQQAQIAIRQGRFTDLLIEWLPPRLVLPMLALAGLPTLFLFGMYYNPPPHLLFVMTSAPLLYRYSGIQSFERAAVASFLLAAWTFLPLIFFSIIGHQEPHRRPLLLFILYLFALYRAWRQYRRAKQDD
ncbi:tetratricopeptide repeat protein [Trichlorobacter lovleyi]|uniref:Tetratricopeptide TPR_2 repeat protein n=1 Tax=Trichlorobacter lovleyi (strain ATCC BAA-1151 / DSM 17278 / SZ) TaxID=398767 RepID=B3E561_TRIL1|nr:tetratricopeptide repeat protein [Trichlorobacter lovleyi]ACD96048.1 Tetratricopeptide TPR_2 repeat protein [Trichlorobacter lovleyi SZ]